MNRIIAISYFCIKKLLIEYKPRTWYSKYQQFLMKFFRKDVFVMHNISNFDLLSFWNDEDPDANEYMDTIPDDPLISSVERELGYTLPASYLSLMKQHNGGVPYATCYPLPQSKKTISSYPLYIEISGFFSIGRKKNTSLCGSSGNPFFKTSWNYPDYGVYICDCPSSGFELILLDYRQCGADGEPSVAYVNMESQEIFSLAPNFETFLNGLVEKEDVEPKENSYFLEKEIIENGDFSPLLIKICRNCGIPQAEQWLRAAARNLLEKKGYFSLQDDPESWLLYDLQYLFYSLSFPKATVTQYLHDYPLILSEDGVFSTNGYTPEYLSAWMENRVREKKLVPAGKMIGQKNCLIFPTEEMESLVYHCKEIYKKFPL